MIRVGKLILRKGDKTFKPGAPFEVGVNVPTVSD